MNEQHVTWPIEAQRLSQLRRESLLLEATALSQGMDTMRIAARGFTAGRAPSCVDFAFQGTISQETSRAAVRAADDRLTAKAVLTAAGLRVPQSRRFGYKNIDEAVEYAQKFRRGAIIKPRMVDAGGFLDAPLTSPGDIHGAIQSWRQTTGARATYLVERRMFSREYAFIIVNGEVVSVGYRRSRRWVREVGAVHADVLALAIQAFNAFPALPHAEVRLFCPDPFGGAERCTVASVKPEIRLMSANKSKAWSVRIAEQLVKHAVWNVSSEQVAHSTHITAAFTMNELSEPQSMSDGISRWMDQVGVVGSAFPGDRLVTGTITGTPGQLAALSGIAKAAKLSSESPQSITFDQQRVTA